MNLANTLYNQQDSSLVESSSDGVILYKLEAIVLTLFIALVGGFIPLRRKSSESFLSLGNCFSGGIFLSAAFLHMLNESIEGFEALNLNTHFPIAMFSTVVGILIPFFVEKVVLEQHDHYNLFDSDSHKSFQSTLGMYALWMMLGVHSLIEGNFTTKI